MAHFISFVVPICKNCKCFCTVNVQMTCLKNMVPPATGLANVGRLIGHKARCQGRNEFWRFTAATIFITTVWPSFSLLNILQKAKYNG